MSPPAVFCTGEGHEGAGDKGDLRPAGEGLIGESSAARLGAGDVQGCCCH